MTIAPNAINHSSGGHRQTKQNTMKKLFIILFTVISSVVMAQTRFYQGNSTYSSDILYNMDGPIPLPVLMMIL